jgi:hypothetical protein
MALRSTASRIACRIVEGRRVGAHLDRGHRAEPRHDERDGRVRLQGAGAQRGHLVDHVDLAGEEGVDPRLGLGDLDDLDLVEVRPAGLPVVRVADQQRAVAGRPALQHERAGADGEGLRVEDVRAVLDHEHVPAGEHGSQVRQRLGQRDHDGPVVDGAGPAQVHDGQVGGRGLGRVEHPPDAVEHVPRGQRRPVAEQHPGAQVHRPLGAVGVGLQRLCEPVAQGQVRLVRDEPVPDVLAERTARGRPGDVRVQRVRRGGLPRQRDPQPPALPGRAGGGLRAARGTTPAGGEQPEPRGRRRPHQKAPSGQHRPVIHHHCTSTRVFPRIDT